MKDQAFLFGFEELFIDPRAVVQTEDSRNLVQLENVDVVGLHHMKALLQIRAELFRR